MVVQREARGPQDAGLRGRPGGRVPGAPGAELMVEGGLGQLGYCFFGAIFLESQEILQLAAKLCTITHSRF